MQDMENGFFQTERKRFMKLNIYNIKEKAGESAFSAFIGLFYPRNQ